MKYFRVKVVEVEEHEKDGVEGYIIKCKNECDTWMSKEEFNKYYREIHKNASNFSISYDIDVDE